MTDLERLLIDKCERYGQNGAEVNEAIPPAYTEHIGRQLIDHLNATK